MKDQTKKMPKLALVSNPGGAGRMTVGGAKRKTMKKKSKSSRKATAKRRSNPTVKGKTVRASRAKTIQARRSNPTVKARSRRRRSNPASSIGSLLGGAAMAAVGITVFDVMVNRVVPSASGVIRAGVKIGGAVLLQSKFGAKIPVLGAYSKDIALVLAVLGVVDLYKMFVAPLITNVLGDQFALQPAAAQAELGWTSNTGEYFSDQNQIAYE